MTYVYSCSDCNKTFEISGTFDIMLQKHECPHCKSKNTKKMITAPSIIYHGTGWTRKKNNLDIFIYKFESELLSLFVCYCFKRE